MTWEHPSVAVLEATHAGDDLAGAGAYSHRAVTTYSQYIATQHTTDHGTLVGSFNAIVESGGDDCLWVRHNVFLGNFDVFTAPAGEYTDDDTDWINLYGVALRNESGVQVIAESSIQSQNEVLTILDRDDGSRTLRLVAELMDEDELVHDVTLTLQVRQGTEAELPRRLSNASIEGDVAWTDAIDRSVTGDVPVYSGGSSDPADLSGLATDFWIGPRRDMFGGYVEFHLASDDAARPDRRVSVGLTLRNSDLGRLAAGTYETTVPADYEFASFDPSAPPVTGSAPQFFASGVGERWLEDGGSERYAQFARRTRVVVSENADGSRHVAVDATFSGGQEVAFEFDYARD